MFGEFMRKWRVKKLLTLKKTARILGLNTKQAVSEIERLGQEIKVVQMIRFKKAVCDTQEERIEFDKELEKIVVKYDKKK